jgi:hypothetical protein
MTFRNAVRLDWELGFINFRVKISQERPLIFAETDGSGAQNPADHILINTYTLLIHTH